MKTLLWYAFLILFGAPALVGILLGIFDFDKAKQGRQNIVLTVIAIVISIGLFFISLIELHRNGLFASFKGFIYLILKFIISGIFMANWIIALVGDQQRSNWRTRINKACNGSLGKTLQKYLPSDSLYYSVDSYYGEHSKKCMAIYYLEGNSKHVITLKSLGYEDIPPEYSDVICQWIQNNIVLEKGAYKIEGIYIEYESYVGGATSGYVETKRTYSGYESRYVAGDSGRYETKKKLTGYKLVHNSYHLKKQKPALKKW